MSNTELLEQRDSMGWASATTAPPRFAARIVEIRSAQLDKKPIPAPSRAFVAEAELRYVAPRIRKLNPLPASMLTSSQLLAKAARQAEQIDNGRYERELAAAILENRVDAAYADVRAGRNPFARYSPLAVEAASEDGGQASAPAGDTSNTLRCIAGSTSASASDHQRAVTQHREMAKRCKDLESGCRHHAAADAHELAAVTSTRANDALVACRAACLPLSIKQ
jgi:hypothetical protein